MVSCVKFTDEKGEFLARFLDKGKKEDRGLIEDAFSKIGNKYGKESHAYKSVINGISLSNLTGSQTFFSIELGFTLPEDMRVASLEDWGKIFSEPRNKTFMHGFCSSIPEIILRSGEEYFKKDIMIARDLGKKLSLEDYEFSPERPLLMQGINLEASQNGSNAYGVSFKIDGADIKNDERFAAKRDEIGIGKVTKKLITDFYGLSGLEIIGARYVNSKVKDLAKSDPRGRIVLIERIK